MNCYHLPLLEFLLPNIAFIPIAENASTTIIITRVTKLPPKASKSSALAEFIAFISAKYNTKKADIANTTSIIVITVFTSFFIFILILALT